MKKSKAEYLCRECGFTDSRWLGKCPSCGKWDSFEKLVYEESIREIGLNHSPRLASEVLIKEHSRFSTNMECFDQVMGGGVVAGSSILLSGEPGIGKSTLLMQILPYLASNGKVLYFSGEELEEQLALRVRRLGIEGKNVLLKYSPYVEHVLEDIENYKPQVVAIDSIQTILSGKLAGGPGTITQVKECSQLLIRKAKEKNIPIFIIGHVTKEGIIAGPKTLEHLVDVVLYLEGDGHDFIRVLRTSKNRFGSSLEIAFFEMTGKGFKEVLEEDIYRSRGSFSFLPGTALSAILEGSRLLIVEVQALISPSYSPFPRRVVTGLDLGRMLQLLAVVERRWGLNIGKSDIYLSTTGSLITKDRAVDLAVVGALLSSYNDKPNKERAVFLGEVGLQGEVRSVPQLARRMRELSKRGYREVIIPDNGFLKEEFPGVDTKTVKEIRDLKNIY